MYVNLFFFLPQLNTKLGGLQPDHKKRLKSDISPIRQNKAHAFAGFHQCGQCNSLGPLIERVVLGIQQIDVAVHRLEVSWLPNQVRSYTYTYIWIYIYIYIHLLKKSAS